MLIEGIIIVGKTIHIGDSRINSSLEKYEELYYIIGSYNSRVTTY